MSNLKKKASEFENKFISSSLEKRLSSDAKQELAEELKTNPEYFKRLENDEDFQLFIRSKFKRKEVSPALVDSIKSKIGF
ncbi:MAG: hypothetical protein P8P48_00355 [Saprospiraceae bacterium]|nr:hypothetical protein [Saprospiraceae bacterium]